MSPNLGSPVPFIRAGPKKFTYRPKKWHVRLAQSALKNAAAAASSEAKEVQGAKPDSVRA